MSKVVIASAVRTPVGTLGGNLAGLTEQALAALVFNEAVKRSGVDAETLDEAILGVAKQTSLPSNCARYAVLEAGLPLALSAYTVHRQSASGLQAIANGYWRILNGDAEAVLAGGSESMSKIPLEIRNARYSFGERTEILYHPIEAQVAGAQPKGTYGVQTAETLAAGLAERYGLGAEALAEYAAQSLTRAQTETAGESVLPVSVKQGKTTVLMQRDQGYPAPCETARPGDASAACVLLSAERASALGVPVLAEVIDLRAAAGDPVGDGLTGLDAVRKLLKRTGIGLEQIQRIELGELSAAQCLAARGGLTDLGLTSTQAEERVNPGGGFLATGNPWGAGGAVLTARLLDGLKGSGALGLVVSPSEGGQSMAALIRVME